MTPSQALTRVRTHGLKQFSNYEVVADPAGAYVLVELTKGQWCEVDMDDWFGGLDRIKWCAMWNMYTGTFYAYGRIEGGNGKCAFMHRLVLELTDPKLKSDHINHDTLCNRRTNLRIGSQSQNGQNRRGLQTNNSSGFLGVHWHAQRKKWAAEISCGGIREYLGLFDDPVAAARARDSRAVDLHGVFARLNFQGAKQ